MHDPNFMSNTPALEKSLAAAGGLRWPLADGDGRCLTELASVGLMFPAISAGSHRTFVSLLVSVSRWSSPLFTTGIEPRSALVFQL